MSNHRQGQAKDSIPKDVLVAALGCSDAKTLAAHMHDDSSVDVLKRLSAQQILSLSHDEFALLLQRPSTRLDGKPNPAYQRWVRIVRRLGLRLPRKKCGLTNGERYRIGKGAHRGRQRIEELEAFIQGEVEMMKKAVATAEQLLKVGKQASRNAGRGEAGLRTR
jgi:hypothetical protein